MAQEIIEIKATARPRAGKGAARQARRDGNVPAVIYGDGKPAETIALDDNDLWKQFIKGHFTSTVFDVARRRRARPASFPRERAGRSGQGSCRSTSTSCASARTASSASRSRSASSTRASSPGLKRGGVLNIVRHEIEVYCPYDRIPAFFEVNLEGLEIGRSIHISAVKLPEGVKPVIQNRDFTVATIAGAKKEEEEAPSSQPLRPRAPRVLRPLPAAGAEPRQGCCSRCRRQGRGSAGGKGAARAGGKGAARSRRQGRGEKKK